MEITHNSNEIKQLNSDVPQINTDNSDNSTKGDDDRPKIEKIESCLKFKYAFRYNVVLKQVEFRNKEKKDSVFEALDERQENDMICELHKEKFKNFKDIFKSLVNSSAFCKAFNPFNHYFETLPKWNGETDHIQDLCNYVVMKNKGAKDHQMKHEWFSRMFKKHLVRAVACAFRILSFNKHCFTLQGKQNDGKTSFIRFLTPPILEEYYKENLDFAHKDSSFAICQNLLINLDELHNLNKQDANKVKSLFSQADNKTREHFGKRDTMQVRFASFFATTNDCEFLNDTTGNVRWLIFEVAQFLWSGENSYKKKVDINSVWSQAYGLMKSNFECKLTDDELKTIESENRKFQVSTLEMELIQKYFQPSDEDDIYSEFMSAGDILIELQALVGNAIKVSSGQIGKALQFLGFERNRSWDKSSNNTKNGYYVKKLYDHSAFKIK